MKKIKMFTLLLYTIRPSSVTEKSSVIGIGLDLFSVKYQTSEIQLNENGMTNIYIYYICSNICLDPQKFRREEQEFLHQNVTVETGAAELFKEDRWQLNM